MKLTGIHLFGILLLSLLVGSFLGKFIGGYKEGIDPVNQHTGGNIPPPQAASVVTIPDDPVEPSKDSNDSTPPPPENKETFSLLFDSILPSNFEKFQPLEPFLVEGMTSSSSSSKGITKDQIPPGQEHLYILKSQVVPPSCPVNPGFNKVTSENEYNDNAAEEDEENENDASIQEDGSSGLSNGLGAAFNSSNGTKNKKCPPCPACARCPEPSFECKKVPNYSVGSNGSMSVPRPVLADFTQFGM
jgi:hypothetical protein